MSGSPRPSRFDRLTERATRELARRTSRRTFVARLGAYLLGTAAFPLLPIDRAFAARLPDGRDVKPKETGDPGDPGNTRACDYWRYCGIDGFLCSCCGGTHTKCPPGTEMSTITWIGTCRNPADDKHYLISYNDCCGKSACGRCFCNGNERETPVYQPARNNDIQWCLGTESVAYSCSVAIIVGVSDEAS